MKSISPKLLLLLITVMLAMISSAGIIIYMYSHTGQIRWLGVFLCFCISFFSCGFLLICVDILLLKKIDHLLDTVKNFRANGNNPSNTVQHSNNNIDNLNQEILAWADDRKNEIERLHKLELYRKEFLGNVSHELKTPIFNIQGYVLTLLDGGLEDPSINRNYLERAEKSVDRMITIIDDLEAISQLETGELQIEPEKFDIVALARDV
ncbi:MAG: sensor histidine kinase, partial [Bacteroidia bacterium]